ncbi:MFS transporter [Pseudonocardiaceae bacterium YIM PH 21723]|nr:MFS transporter [Pseudonocardiaceae bacterium YIM PH 21723]
MYDFIIYGVASATVFNKLFFPHSDPLTSLLLAFATFGAGFAARPVGGVIIGHFGDRLGRRGMLVLTLLGTGLSTVAIGLLPTYASIGALAPILLVTLRVLQGLFVGGESGGAILLVSEHAPEGRKGWYGSWVFMGGPIGQFLATASFTLAATISGDGFLDWGWRVPFLLSLLMVAVGLYVRLQLPESPEFLEIDQKARRPLAELLRTEKRRVFIGVGVSLGFQAFIIMLTTFVVAYVEGTLRLPKGLALNAVLLGSVANMVTTPIAGAAADRWGRQRVMLTGTTCMALYAFPFFWLLDTRSPAAIYLALALGFAVVGFLWGPMASFFAELFPVRVRYTGVAFSFQLGAVLGGGLVPLAATALLKQSGGASWPVSVYLLLGALIALGSLLALPRVRARELARV